MQLVRAALAACFLASTAALSSGVASPKVALRGLFSRGDDRLIVDPVTKGPLRRQVSVIGSQVRERCVSTTGAAYPVTDIYVDLLPTSGRSSPLTLDNLQQELQDAWSTRVQTGLFRSPLTSFLYERGWRDNFKRAGFPGIEKEFEEVQQFFAPVAEGGTVVDMSCGSGLMTRRLVTSGAYEQVLALDYSESMLQETARRVREERLPTDALMLCRADVASLPLRTGAIDALHAGAAMHCWPRLEDGLREICRSLKPGGRFFATTFLQGAYGAGMPRQSGGGSFRFFEGEEELRQLLLDAGFDQETLQVRTEGRGCAVIRASAPSATAVDETTPAVAVEVDTSSVSQEEEAAPEAVDYEAAAAVEEEDTEDAAPFSETIEQME